MDLIVATYRRNRRALKLTTEIEDLNANDLSCLSKIKHTVEVGTLRCPIARQPYRQRLASDPIISLIGIQGQFFATFRILDPAYIANIRFFGKRTPLCLDALYDLIDWEIPGNKPPAIAVEGAADSNEIVFE